MVTGTRSPRRDMLNKRVEDGRRAAEEALLDRTLITVSDDAYKKFLARLDARPKPNARLRKTMRGPA